MWMMPFSFLIPPATLHSSSIFLMLWTIVHLHKLEGCVSQSHWLPLEKAEAPPVVISQVFINFCMSHNGLKVMINSVSNGTITSSKKDCRVQNTCSWSKPRSLSIREFKNAGTFFHFSDCIRVAQNTTVFPNLQKETLPVKYYTYLLWNTENMSVLSAWWCF